VSTDASVCLSTPVPNPLDKYYLSPSADLAGNVYVERSGAACASNATLMK